MNFLIDTNIISELRKGPRCNVHVARWYEKIDGENLHLSVLVLGEIRKGIEGKRPRDKAQATALEKWLGEIRENFGNRILPVDQKVADEWGRLNAIRSLPVIDGMLGATARVHKMALVTRNTSDLAGLGVRLLNPFEERR